MHRRQLVDNVCFACSHRGGSGDDDGDGDVTAQLRLLASCRLQWSSGMGALSPRGSDGDRGVRSEAHCTVLRSANTSSRSGPASTCWTLVGTLGA
mmetsp:Transcript_40604/g.93348  ORF Transcript_40604/g.93348 Transcript_40604/m.93348 type:complete len:95 (+) Transcript_40604:207-491(+)